MITKKHINNLTKSLNHQTGINNIKVRGIDHQIKIKLKKN
jgi:hypothetical protein